MTLRTKTPKPKTCKVCRCKFKPRMSLAIVCSNRCAQTLAVSIRGKAAKVAAVKERKDTKDKLNKLKSRSAWAKEAQSAFNLFIRLRDVEQPCISCGRHHQGQYHAGHFLSVGAHPELRFSELNVHKQCAPCNTHLSGNAVLYRKALVLKIGAHKLDWLEGHHPMWHYTTYELKAIKADYTARVRELQKGMV